MDINAKEEFLSECEGKEIKCVSIERNLGYSKNDRHLGKKKIILKVGYKETDLEEFLQKLDFMYDWGFGAQYVFGTIWYKDGTWSERYEYDGREDWNYKKSPKIPKELL